MKLNCYDENVYKNIYYITKQYMEKQNVLIPFSEKVFMCSVGHNSNEVDMSTWADFEQIDFINNAYLELLNRFPLEEDILYWLHQQNYKEKLIATILSSMEFKSKHIKIYNKSYDHFTLKQKIFNYLVGSNSENLHSRFLYKLYRIFPKSIKTLIRNFWGVNN